MKHLIIIFLLSSFMSINNKVYSQNLPKGINLYIQPEKGSIDDRFTLQLNLNFEDSDKQPQIEENSDFKIIGKSQSSQTQIINGRISNQVAYIYILTPKKTGELKTPNIKVFRNGEEVTIPGKTINVSKALVYDSNNNKKDLRLELSADSLDVYKGEQIYVRAELLTSINIHEIQPVNTSFNNSWIEDLEQKPSFSTSRNGKNYRALRLENIIFPNNTGELIIKPREFKLKVDSTDSQKRYRQRFGFDPFDINSIFGSQRSKTINLKSNSLNINVKELPKSDEELFIFENSDIPVGKTSILANLSSDSIKVNENITLTIKITSKGLINSIKNLNLNLPDYVKVYADKPVIKKKIFDNKITYTKTFKLSLLPLKASNFLIPSIKLSYFNPETNTYELAKTDSFNIAVIKSNNTNYTNDKSINKTQDYSIENNEKEDPKNYLKIIAESVSVGLGLLILSFVILLCLATFTFIYFLNKPKTKKINISKINTSKELYKEFKEYLASKLNLNSNFLLDEIRNEANKKFSPAITLSIVQILTSLEADIYGKIEGNLEKQKEKVNEITKLLS